MKADLCDFAEAIELPEAAGLLAESVPADDHLSLSGSASEAESLLVMAANPSRDETFPHSGARYGPQADTASDIEPTAAQALGNPHPVRTIAFNVVRFASVLIGAGLLLRTGAAEQAVSAIEDEKPQPERPATARLVLPQPAFGQPETKQGVQTGVADPARLAVPHATFAAVAGVKTSVADTLEDGLANKAAVASAPVAKVAPAPAFAAFDSEFGKSAVGKTASTQPARLATVSGAAEPASFVAPAAARPAARVAPQTAMAAAVAVPAAPKAAPAKALPTPASARQAERPQVAASAPSILSPTRRNLASGLLAPVQVVSRPVIAPVVAAVKSGGTAARPAVASNLASAQAQPAFRTAPAAASVAAPAPRAPALASVAPAASATPGAAAPVKISLATPVMKPGPRTTVLTSDISTVMRRPASAWDYAEALPPELTGRTAPRSASAEPYSQPQDSRPQDSQLQDSRPQVLQPQKVAAAPQPAMARAVPVQSASAEAPVRSALSAKAPAAATRAAMPLSSDGRVVAQTQPQTTQPPTTLAQEPAQAQAGRPLAKLDLPPAVPRSHSVHALAAKPGLTAGKHGLASKHASGGKRKADEPESVGLAGTAQPQDSGQPAARAGTTANADSAFRSSGYDDSAGTSALLADASGASSGPEGSGLSLRDRLPRPAF